MNKIVVITNTFSDGLKRKKKLGINLGPGITQLVPNTFLGSFWFVSACSSSFYSFLARFFLFSSCKSSELGF